MCYSQILKIYIANSKSFFTSMCNIFPKTFSLFNKPAKCFPVTSPFMPSWQITIPFNSPAFLSFETDIHSPYFMQLGPIGCNHKTLFSKMPLEFSYQQQDSLCYVIPYLILLPVYKHNFLETPNVYTIFSAVNK